MSFLEECKLWNICDNHTREFPGRHSFYRVYLLKYMISTAMFDVAKRGRVKVKWKLFWICALSELSSLLCLEMFHYINKKVFSGYHTCYSSFRCVMMISKKKTFRETSHCLISGVHLIRLSIVPNKEENDKADRTYGFLFSTCNRTQACWRRCFLETTTIIWKSWRYHSWKTRQSAAITGSSIKLAATLLQGFNYICT
jgi:hypothetical protein